MPTNRKIVADTFCEVHDLIKDQLVDDFYDLNLHTIVPGAVYVIGRQQMTEHRQRIIELVTNNTIKVIFSNPAEGSDTMYWQARMLGIYDLVLQGKILIITGGYLPANMPHLYYENFLPKILDYDENIIAIEEYRKNSSIVRPYKFLFLNGRTRGHRKYLLEKFSESGLLDQTLWTNLDPRTSNGFRILEWYETEDFSQPQWYSHVRETPFPIKVLPPEYEVDRYQNNSTVPPPNSNNDLFVKKHLFNNEWGEIYLNPKPYLDTYFSLVTETVFDYPHTFRTEKIAKPIAIGHPWIAVSNAGYYRDIHN